MTNYELGREYLLKAEKLKKKIEYLNGELIRKSNYKGTIDRTEALKRIRLLYDMYVDLKSVGTKLTKRKEHTNDKPESPSA